MGVEEQIAKRTIVPHGLLAQGEHDGSACVA
jgi:hypothetical protein